MKSLLLLALTTCLLFSCSASRYAPQTTKAGRDKFRTQLIGTTIEGALSQPLTRETEAKWEGAFWGMSLARYRSGTTTQAIHKAFAEWNTLSPSFQRALLEVVYTMYPDDFLSEAEGIAHVDEERETVRDGGAACCSRHAME